VQKNNLKFTQAVHLSFCLHKKAYFKTHSDTVPNLALFSSARFSEFAG